MDKAEEVVIIIPSRLGSSRLARKPLAKIGDAPMIVQVWRRAIESKVGKVIVACADREIADVVSEAGGEAVITNPDLPSGSDRVFQALEKIDPSRSFDKIVNLQGDLPNIEPKTLSAVLEPLQNPEVDIGTLAARIQDQEQRDDPNVVKVVAAIGDTDATRIARALYFTRVAAPAGDGDLWHHIGIYSYRRSALLKFVGLRQSGLELREKLEQLRALEAGMRIDVARVDNVPIGVDTPADLAKVRQEFRVNE
ncbi:MAG: 3-deoxy-manno-octulosonate cytidylyltransferase [Pseudomonadota bacterium]|nr:3-deoxy-manno-octulosonate cytidylyltransferase [Pseudomonadota bacterium]